MAKRQSFLLAHSESLRIIQIQYIHYGYRWVKTRPGSQQVRRETLKNVLVPVQIKIVFRVEEV